MLGLDFFFVSESFVRVLSCVVFGGCSCTLLARIREGPLIVSIGGPKNFLMISYTSINGVKKVMEEQEDISIFSSNFICYIGILIYIRNRWVL